MEELPLDQENQNCSHTAENLSNEEFLKAMQMEGGPAIYQETYPNIRLDMTSKLTPDTDKSDEEFLNNLNTDRNVEPPVDADNLPLDEAQPQLPTVELQHWNEYMRGDGLRLGADCDDYGEFGKSDLTLPEQNPIEDLDVTELCRHMLLANHLQRGNIHVKLINVQNHVGHTIDLTLLLQSSDLMYISEMTFETDPVEVIVNASVAKTCLISSIPIIQHLSFKDYRLVGGACLNAVRNARESIVDADLFPLVGEIESKVEEEMKALVIYISMLKEIEQIFNEHYSKTHHIVILRNVGCTVINIIPIPNRKSRARRIISTTIQIVHRAFKTESQMLTSGDLIPGQILYNGKDFLCTYPALLALKTNMFPIDISAVSCSMSHRIEKYVGYKRFTAVLCGMRKPEVSEPENVVVDEDDDSGFVSKIRLLPIGLCILDIPPKRVNYRPMAVRPGDIKKISSVLENNTCMSESGTMQNKFGIRGLDLTIKSDYQSIEFCSLKILTRHNLTAYLEGRPDEMCIYANSVQEFLKSPKTTEVEGTFARMMRINKEIFRSDFRIFFGKYAKEAAIAHFDEDKPKYDEITAKRLLDIIIPIEKEFERLNTVIWRIDNQGPAKPVRMPASSFYTDFRDPQLPSYYNGFICTPNWTVKRLIILAWKFSIKECPFSLLPRDILKRIFWLHDIQYLEESSIKYQHLLFREEEPFEIPAIPEVHEWENIDDRWNRLAEPFNAEWEEYDQRDHPGW